MRFANKPLAKVSVGDVQEFLESMCGAPSSKRRAIHAVKSLLTYGQRTGYLVFNVGAAVRVPTLPSRLSERILSEDDVHRIIRKEPRSRNRVMLRMLYLTGCRVSELCSIKWADLAPRGDSGIVTVIGKGNKSRTVLLPKDFWNELQRCRRRRAVYVFQSIRSERPLTQSAVWLIVRHAARRAGLSQNVSPHWLRHAHVSHALDNGAPSHLVQATVGHASLQTTSGYSHARPNDSSALYLHK